MKTSRRVKASRANGAKSRGPKTPEGKLHSQTHAIRHGMLAKCVVLDGEDPETFKLLMAEYEERFAPVDDVELGFIEEMAAAYWRMRRGWTIEAELLNTGMTRQPGGQHARLAGSFTDADLMPKLALLQRYESRLHRMFQRAMNNLMQLREYKPNEQTAEEPDPVSEQSAEPQAQPSEPLAKMPPKSAESPRDIQAGREPSEIPPTAPNPSHAPRNREDKPAA